VKKLVVLSVAAAAVTMASPVSARTFVVESSPSRYIACYDREYVPARVLVNTRGRLVKRASRGWEIAGERWDYVRYPGTYIQTRRVVEPDHYTLVSRGC
jgi:hypothetical protein